MFKKDCPSVLVTFWEKLANLNGKIEDLSFEKDAFCTKVTMK